MIAVRIYKDNLVLVANDKQQQSVCTLYKLSGISVAFFFISLKSFSFIFLLDFTYILSGNDIKL